MSESLFVVKNAAGSGSDVELVSYYGGDGVGKCYQFTVLNGKNAGHFIQFSVKEMGEVYYYAKVDAMGEEVKDDKYHANKVRGLAKDLRKAIAEARNSGIFVDFNTDILDDSIEMARHL